MNEDIFTETSVVIGIIVIITSGFVKKNTETVLLIILLIKQIKEGSLFCIKLKFLADMKKRLYSVCSIA